jgi:predicted small integral membrane protein
MPLCEWVLSAAKDTCSQSCTCPSPHPALYLPCLHLYTHQMQSNRQMPAQTSEQPYNIRTFGMALDLTMWTVPTHSPVFTVLRWWRRYLNRKGLAFVFAIPCKIVKYAVMCRQIQKLKLPPDGLKDMLQMAQAWHGYMEKDKAACCKSFALLEKVALYKKRQQMQVCRLHAYYFMRISCLIYYFLFYVGTSRWNSGGQHKLYWVEENAI